MFQTINQTSIEWNISEVWMEDEWHVKNMVIGFHPQQ